MISLEDLDLSAEDREFVEDLIEVGRQAAKTVICVGAAIKNFLVSRKASEQKLFNYALDEAETLTEMLFVLAQVREASGEDLSGRNEA